MQDLKVTIVQSDLVWENPKANRKNFTKLFKEINVKTDLVVLPEMFSTGFSMNAKKLAEPSYSTTEKWMASQAAKLNCTITGSIMVKDKGKFYNRLVWMPPTGVPKYYDKRHLFSFAKEDKTFTQGKERLIVKIKGWKVCPQICYDLRFPVWSRNTSNYDLLLYIANWPVARINAWNTLLTARSIENQCYTVGVNRIGTDKNKIAYNGNSAIIDYKGNPMVRIADSPFVYTMTLNRKSLHDFRAKFPALLDKDKFEVLD